MLKRMKEDLHCVLPLERATPVPMPKVWPVQMASVTPLRLSVTTATRNIGSCILFREGNRNSQDSATMCLKGHLGDTY